MVGYKAVALMLVLSSRLCLSSFLSRRIGFSFLIRILPFWSTDGVEPFEATWRTENTLRESLCWLNWQTLAFRDCNFVTSMLVFGTMVGQRQSYCWGSHSSYLVSWQIWIERLPDGSMNLHGLAYLIFRPAVANLQCLGWRLTQPSTYSWTCTPLVVIPSPSRMFWPPL